MDIRAIFATDKNGGMGQGDSLPWPHLSKDLKNFSSLTRGHVVIMGRKTWDSSMPTPLPSRVNVVLTRRPMDARENTICIGGSPLQIVKELQDHPLSANKTWWVIGGAEVLRQWLPLCREVYYTEIHGVWPCDSVLAASEWQGGFTQVADSLQEIVDKNGTFSISRWEKA